MARELERTCSASPCGSAVIGGLGGGIRVNAGRSSQLRRERRNTDTRCGRPRIWCSVRAPKMPRSASAYHARLARIASSEGGSRCNEGGGVFCPQSGPAGMGRRRKWVALFMVCAHSHCLGGGRRGLHGGVGSWGDDRRTSSSSVERSAHFESSAPAVIWAGRRVHRAMVSASITPASSHVRPMTRLLVLRSPLPLFSVPFDRRLATQRSGAHPCVPRSAV